MFFSPTIALLKRRRADIHILCLSTGEKKNTKPPCKTQKNPVKHKKTL